MKAFLRESHRRLVFRYAFRELRNLIARDCRPDPALLERLRYGWGNEGWSASAHFIRGCIDEAARCDGPILECGSGLTTLIIGAIAEKLQLPFVSLEHSAGWLERVRSVASSMGIRGISIEHAPLRDYDGFSWYEFNPKIAGDLISLVVCDGPPVDSPGGRYGLLPITRSKLRDTCVILLDDAIRADEQAIVQRWQQEESLHCETLGEPNPYFRLTFNLTERESAQPRAQVDRDLAIGTRPV
jgi:hypothetical protein